MRGTNKPKSNISAFVSVGRGPLCLALFRAERPAMPKEEEKRDRTRQSEAEKSGVDAWSSTPEGAMCACRNRRLSLRPGMRGMLADRSHRRPFFFPVRLISFRMLVARQTLLCKTVDCLRVSSGRQSIPTAVRFASPAHENLLEPVDTQSDAKDLIKNKISLFVCADRFPPPMPRR